jgi:hypothetical protein
VKEGLKERLRNEINENRVTISNGKEKYSLTENELRELVSKAIHNVSLREASDFSQFSNNEFLSFREKLSDLRIYASHMIDFADAKGDSRFVSYIGSLIRNLDGFINFIDERYR